MRRLHLTVGEVSEAFASGRPTEAAAARPRRSDPDDTFIDLYVALVERAGDRPQPARRAATQAQQRLKPGQQAILVAGNGAYSFKGSGYVRGGIFDRIELVQGDSGDPLPRPQSRPAR